MDPITRGRQALITPLTGSEERSDKYQAYKERQAAATEIRLADRREVQRELDEIAAAKQTAVAERVRTEEERALERAENAAKAAKAAQLEEKQARLDAKRATDAHIRALRLATHWAKAKNDWYPATIDYKNKKIIPGHWHWERFYGV